MNLYEAKQILKKAGYLIKESVDNDAETVRWFLRNNIDVYGDQILPGIKSLIFTPKNNSNMTFDELDNAARMALIDAEEDGSIDKGYTYDDGDDEDGELWVKYSAQDI